MLKVKFNTFFKRTILVIALTILMLFVLMIYHKLFLKYHFAIPCLFHKITNFYCPGCGATRVIFAFLKLDLQMALRQNFVLTFIFPFLGICFLDKIIAWIRDKKTFFAHKIPSYIWYIMLIILLIFGILRNVPFFEFLRPL